MVDLHTHSTCSDGTVSPAGIVDEAARVGLHAVALTDHDTIEGNASFLTAAASCGIRAVAGVEISAEFIHPENRGGAGDDGELHILGFFAAWSDAAAAALAPLAEIRRNREERNPQIVRKLQDLGCAITYDEVVRHAGNDVVGRPHIAAVMLEKGFVRSTQAAFDRYLGRDAAAFVSKRIFAPDRAIGLIATAGGLPVLAHPRTLDIRTDEAFRRLLSPLIGCGLRGIEAYYPVHEPRDTARYCAYAAEFDLLVTGGSDFHGANKPDIALGKGFGRLAVPDVCFDALCAAHLLAHP